MMDLLERLTRLIESNLAHATAVRALLIGLLCSVGLTQLVKFASQLQHMTDRQFRIAVRVFAAVAAFVPTWALWPEAGWPGLIVATVMAIVVPFLYLLVSRIAVHRWPWLDDLLSARPADDEGKP